MKIIVLISLFLSSPAVAHTEMECLTRSAVMKVARDFMRGGLPRPQIIDTLLRNVPGNLHDPYTLDINWSLDNLHISDEILEDTAKKTCLPHID